VTLLPVLLVVHVALALALLLPSLLLPFALRAGRSPRAGDGIGGRLVTLQANGAGIVGAGVAVSGAALVVAVGPQLVAQPWLLAALAVYAANLVLAFFVQRPNLAALLGVRASRDDVAWRARARRQRYVSYAMAGLTGTIGFLMSTKPSLW
jgi:hypothetical protein